MAEKFRLKAPTIALFPEDGRHVARTVPEGAVLDVQTLDGSRLIEVFWDGKRILMFAVDVQSRGEKVEDTISPDIAADIAYVACDAFGL